MMKIKKVHGPGWRMHLFWLLGNVLVIVGASSARPRADASIGPYKTRVENVYVGKGRVFARQMGTGRRGRRPLQILP